MTGIDMIDRMAATSRSGLRDLLHGIRHAALVDFPDYANVGDSAIALGLLKFARESGIRVSVVGTLHQLERSLRSLDQVDAVIVNGGGNLGDLYPHHQDLRRRLLKDLPKAVRFIQAPQSVSFSSDAAVQRFGDEYLARSGSRIAVRDYASQATLRDAGIDAMVSPDCAHVLGRLRGASPRKPLSVIARTDGERESSGARPRGSGDWIEENLFFDFGTKIRSRLGRAGQLNPSVSAWERIANARLRRGIGMLASGGLVLTDRLHATILAIHLDRNVIVVDNSNRKISRYLETWRLVSAGHVTLAASWAEALRISRTAYGLRLP